MNKKSIAWIGLVVIIFCFILYPFKVPVVPLWRIQVIDSSGKPLPSLAVRQVWQHYSVEQDDHQEVRITDENGYATFPEREVRASLLQRAFVILTNAPWVVHASWGAHSYLIVLAGPDYLNDAASYNGNDPPPSQVILRRMDEIPPLENYEPIIK